MKNYLGFAIRQEEKEEGILFRRKRTKENFCRVRVGANNFAEAQEMLCDKMQMYKMSIAFISPYTEEDMK